VDTSRRRGKSGQQSGVLGPVRRIVTGHDSLNRSVVVSDGMPERVLTLTQNGPTFYEIWNTQQSPAMIDRASTEPNEANITLAPPTGGTRIRILDILPEGRDIKTLDADAARAHFAELGAAQASTHAGTHSRHPFMHRTESIDYCIVLQGEITLILEEGETVARAGDIVIQRGTDHAWANRSGRMCRMAFVLIDGKLDPELK
jgi:microcystin-dependent protein